MGGKCTGRTEQIREEYEAEQRAALEAEETAREEREKQRIAREEEERAAIPPIGLIVQREDGQPEAEVEVRPWEPVHGSLGKALGLSKMTHRLTEAWLGELQLEGEGSWESQGVVDGATVRAVVEKKTALVVVADAQKNNRLQVFRLDDGWVHRSGYGGVYDRSADGGWLYSIGSKGDEPGQFDYPCCVAADGQGNLIVADAGNHRVQVLRLEDGSHVRTIGSRGEGPGQFDFPKGVATDGQGLLIVADHCNHRVQVLRLEDGSHVRTIGSKGSGPGQLKSPCGVATDGQGHLIVADTGNRRVEVFQLEDGTHVRSIGSEGWMGVLLVEEGQPTQFESPQGVAVDGQGGLFVVDSRTHRIEVFRLENGSHIRSIGRQGKRRGLFDRPSGVAVDAEGHLIVADYGNHRVQVLQQENADRDNIFARERSAVSRQVRGHVRTIESHDNSSLYYETRPPYRGADRPSRFENPTGVTVGYV